MLTHEGKFVQEIRQNNHSNKAICLYNLPNLPLNENELIIAHTFLTHLCRFTKESRFKGFLSLQVAQCGQECSTCCLGYSLLYKEENFKFMSQ